MHTLAYLLFFTPLLASCAPYADKCDGYYYQPSGCASPTASSSPPPSSTSCVPTTTPTKAYTVKALAPETPIDGLKMNAGSLGFHLGGGTAAYCPISVGALCPPGNETVFTFGSISVLVPGGQQQYTETGGRLGYTQAHSISMPPGALPGGFGYEKCPGEEYGRITKEIFGGKGVMACPEDNSETPVYVVYAKIPDADVPTGNVEDCIDFVGLTTDYDGPLPAAWQY